MTINVMTDNEIKEANADIDSDNNLLKEMNVIIKDAAKELPVLNAKMQEHTKGYEECKEASNHQATQRQKAINTVPLLKNRILEREKQLSDNQVNEEILALYDKQTVFWESLELRISQRRDELRLGLVGMKEPLPVTDAIAKIKALGEAPGYQEPGNTIQAYLLRYKETLLDMCQMQIQGKPVPADTSQRRLTILDNFLMEKRIQGYWS